MKGGVIMSNPTTYPGIPMSLLAHLVDRAGKAGDISPRHLWRAASPDTRQAQELFEAGITAAPESNAALTAGFAKIAGTILNPGTNLTFRAWGDSYSAVESNIQFPGQIRDGAGVALNQVDGLFQIGACFNERDILEQLIPLLPLVPDSAQTLTFEAHLPLPLAITLMAVLDLYRGAEFPDGPYASATVNGYIQGQWGLAGMDKFLGFFPALGVSTAPPSQAAVEAGLKTLASLAFLDEVGEGFYELCIDLLPLVGQTCGELPGLQWQRVHSSEDGTLLTANRIWLIGREGLILMLSPMSDSSVFIKSIQPETMTEFISDELAGPIPVARKIVDPPVEEQVTETSTPGCLKCGASMAPGDKFCASCGSPFEQLACPKCKAKISSNASFCSSCGESLSRPTPPQKVKIQPTKKLPQTISRFPLTRAALLIGFVGIFFVASILTAYFLANPKHPIPPWLTASKDVAIPAQALKTGKKQKAANADQQTAQFSDSKTSQDNKKTTPKTSSAEAFYQRAEDYYRGRNGLEQNYAKALSFYRRAAEHGHAPAEYSLGYLYDNGKGVEIDDAKAVRFYHRAAESGHAKAQRSLGYMYAEGEGVEKDPIKGFLWTQKAAHQGEEQAQRNLAIMYENGRGVDKNIAKATEWYRKAAEQGNVKAQTTIGVMYYHGNGVTQNYQTALDWFRKAAEKDHPTAQFNIGVMHEKGQGMGKNKALAIEWYLKAAKQGYSDALKRLRTLGVEL